ncbi:MAG: hypothetical protein F6K32_05565 [Desertifilum sp. SIO1I2]|nr:hypothetical protein [Desertifilum sp. SIO1I2]
MIRLACSIADSAVSRQTDRSLADASALFAFEEMYRLASSLSAGNAIAKWLNWNRCIQSGKCRSF